MVFRFTVEDSERSQQLPAYLAAPSHNSRRDLSSGARRRQERKRALPSLANPSSSSNSSSSSSLPRADLYSAVLRLSSLRLGAHLEVPSNPHSQPVDCLGIPRPNSSPLKVDLCSGVPQPNQFRVDSLARNSRLNNSREVRFSVAHNNRLNSRGILSLGAPNNPPSDRRQHCSGRGNNNLPPGLQCSAAHNSNRQDPRCLVVRNPHYTVPLPP